MANFEMVESENDGKNCFVIEEPEKSEKIFDYYLYNNYMLGINVSSVVEFQKSTYSKEIIIFCE